MNDGVAVAGQGTPRVHRPRDPVSVTAAILTVPRPVGERLSPTIVCSRGRSLLFHGVTGGGEIVGNDAAAAPAMQALLPAAGEPASPTCLTSPVKLV